MIDAGKLPLMLCFLAFVVTFLTTRSITRLIRDGRGPFHNISSGGTHIHHSIPGLILLIVGAFTSIGGPQNLGWRSVAGVLIGIGVSLVLDEFALILHLQDVYWTGEGQVSVEAVSLTAACLGLALVGFTPFGVSDVNGVELSFRLSATALFSVDGVLALVCVFKGKYRAALFGFFLPPIAVLVRVPAGPSEVEVGPAALRRQADGARDQAGGRIRQALGPVPDRLGGLRRRQTVAAGPRHHFGRAIVNDHGPVLRIPSAIARPRIGSVARMRWSPRPIRPSASGCSPRSSRSPTDRCRPISPTS